MGEMHDEGADMDQEIRWLRQRINAMHSVIRDLRAENDDLRKRLELPLREHREV
jgi:regulator of replication initiation timing